MEFGKESTEIRIQVSGKTVKLMVMVFMSGKMVHFTELTNLGDKYEGEWKACLRHGNGSDFFNNGDKYVG